MNSIAGLSFSRKILCCEPFESKDQETNETNAERTHKRVAVLCIIGGIGITAFVHHPASKSQLHADK